MKKVQDHYFHKAKREGYAARSAFKLEEIDRKAGLLKPGMRVLDLGSAPGSWLQYVARRVGEGGRAVGIDLQPVNVALGPNIRLIQGDIDSLSSADILAGEPLFGLILSDMAPKTTGIPSGDAARSAQLVLRVLELAPQLLAPGGAVVAKIFQGAPMEGVRRAFQDCFDKVKIEKPKATRKESVEVFLLGLGFKPPGPQPDED